MKFSPWLPYIIAACLLVLNIVQCFEILRVEAQRTRLQAGMQSAGMEIIRLEQSNALISLRLVALDAKDPAYAAARVFVAWDANQHRGSIALQDFPLTPAGHDYQLWVLDPNASSPLSAGVITGARVFEVDSCSMARPGFALSLEASGGSTSLTGPILFAVAPAE